MPPLAHWLLCRPCVPQSDIGTDGHPRRGEGLTPPIDLPRRMWAGSRVDFVQSVRVGETIERRSKILAIEAKTGRKGDMVFVSLEHRIKVQDAVSIVERQDIVYRPMALRGRGPEPVPPDLPEPDVTDVITPDPVQLFRYSALTLNSHRIHYDADYARDTEFYPGLVVHGPYAATLLINHFQKAFPDAQIASFSFRALAPLFSGNPLTLCLAGKTLWIRDHEGQVAMTADIEVL